MQPDAKILSLEQADEWVSQQKRAGRKIGFTCGAFDLLHAGHVQYLAEARQLCDCLLVAVNTDASIQRYKNPLRPFQPERDRQYVVAGLSSVDAVTALDGDRPVGLIERWKPDLYVKGGDYSESSLRSGETVKSYGGRVEVIRPAYSSSSTKLAERISLATLHAKPADVSAPAERALVLLDRDGTLIRNVPFLHEPDRVEILPSVTDGLLDLQKAGCRLAIVTNQQGIGLGYFDTDAFIAVNQRLLQIVGKAGVRIAKIYYCPHSLADNCACRKPKGGMIVRAMREQKFPASATFYMGDSQSDLDAAEDAGCAGILAGTGQFADATNEVIQRLARA